MASCFCLLQDRTWIWWAFEFLMFELWRSVPGPRSTTLYEHCGMSGAPSGSTVITFALFVERKLHCLSRVFLAVVAVLCSLLHFDIFPIRSNQPTYTDFHFNLLNASQILTPSPFDVSCRLDIDLPKCCDWLQPTSKYCYHTRTKGLWFELVATSLSPNKGQTRLAYFVHLVLKGDPFSLNTQSDSPVICKSPVRT